jgi:hypothetical protein
MRYFNFYIAVILVGACAAVIAIYLRIIGITVIRYLQIAAKSYIPVIAEINSVR